MTAFRSALGLLLLITMTPVSAQSSLDVQHIDRLRGRLQQLAGSFPGKAGLYVRNLETGAELGINANDSFPMASVYKIPIMVEVFRQADAGRLSLGERVTLTVADRRLGSGLLPYFSPGLNPTIHDLILLMITVSDNAATDLLVKRVGPANVTATMRQLGIQNVRVDRTTQQIIANWIGAADPTVGQRLMDPSLAGEEVFTTIPPERIEQANRAFPNDPRDQASPRAIADLLTKIFRSQAASEKSCNEMLEILKQQQLREGIPRYLRDLTVANKTGQIGYTTNDAGILYAGEQHIALTVFTLRASEEVSVEQAHDHIARIARAVVDYFQYVSPGR